MVCESSWRTNSCPRNVLILVLMEYGLRESCFPTACPPAVECLNPCFNGIWSARRACIAFWLLLLCLNPCFNGIWSARGLKKTYTAGTCDVLILVLMEYGLRALKLLEEDETNNGLNPCFNGIWSASITIACSMAFRAKRS